MANLTQDKNGGPWYEKARIYREMEDSARRTKPAEGMDYDWVFDYAVDAYRSLLNVNYRADDEAGFYIKLLGGVFGILSLSLLLVRTIEDPLLLGFALAGAAPSLFSTLHTIHPAILLRQQPPPPLLPLPIEAHDVHEAWAIKIDGSWKSSGAKGCLGLWINLYCVGLTLVINHKRVLLEKAAKRFHRTLFLTFLIPIFILVGLLVDHVAAPDTNTSVNPQPKVTFRIVRTLELKGQPLSW